MTAAPARHDGRHRGREAALQMLYQWELGRADPDEVLRTFWGIRGAPRLPRVEAFAGGLLKGTIANLDTIDPLIAAAAKHWRLSRMATVDRLIMRLAVYEFLHAPEVPRTVVINEALELAKTFSTDDSVKFINGVLDAIRRQLEEVASRQ